MGQNKQQEDGAETKELREKEAERVRTAVQSKPRERIRKQEQKTALQPLSTRFTDAPSRNLLSHFVI